MGLTIPAATGFLLQALGMAAPCFFPQIYLGAGGGGKPRPYTHRRRVISNDGLLIPYFPKAPLVALNAPNSPLIPL